MQRRTSGVRRLALLAALATAGVLVIGAHAASAGVIEICKSSANGMSSRVFTYAISSGSSVTVLGGRCSGPITVAGGSVTVTEGTSDPATDVAAVLVRPSIRKQSAALVGRSVTVAPGASTANETLVTFVNEPVGGTFGTLKVCKVTESSVYVGRPFTFTANGGPAVTVEAGDARADSAAWSCRMLGSFPVGSVVKVHEQLPPGASLYWVDADPFTALDHFDIAAANSWITVGAGTTIALFDNEPLPPSGTGWLEVCKDRAFVAGSPDDGVQGTFAFAVTDAAGFTHSLSVLAGQCSEPFAVTAGLAQVQELGGPGTSLASVYAIPGDRLLSANLVNRTATVEVPASADPADETQVHFVNQAQRGQLKICKALGPSSALLAGQTFWFDWRASTGATGLLPITAAASTQCRILGDFPIGTVVSVEERNPGAFVDSQSVGSVRVGSGVSTLTVTNTASGVLEICKARIPTAAVQPTFRFRVDASAATMSVQAGKCSLPLRVAIGNHAVTELADDAYELDASRADGGIAVYPADREVGRNLGTRTVTVFVPYGAEGETLVTFHNRLKAGLVKICKLIPPTSQDALGGKLFTYLIGQATHIGPIRPGECILVPNTFPVQDSAGLPATFTVHEDGTPSATWNVTAITVSGSAGVVSTDKANGTVTFKVGPGVNVVTFTNAAK